MIHIGPRAMKPSGASEWPHRGVTAIKCGFGLRMSSCSIGAQEESACNTRGVACFSLQCCFWFPFETTTNERCQASRKNTTSHTFVEETKPVYELSLVNTLPSTNGGTCFGPGRRVSIMYVFVGLDCVWRAVGVSSDCLSLCGFFSFFLFEGGSPGPLLNKAKKEPSAVLGVLNLEKSC